MICQLCPTQKIIRQHDHTTSNLLKHVKRVHLKELKIVKAKYKQPEVENIDFFTMTLEEEKEATVVDDENEIQ